MKKQRDVTPIDFAINLDDLCILIERNKELKKRGYVSVKLCRGEYNYTSNGPNVLDEGVLYEHRFSSFPSAINSVSKFYADKEGMTFRPIEFSEDEVFTKWVLGGGSIGIYSFLTEEIPKEKVFIYQHKDEGSHDTEEVLRAFIGEEKLNNRIFDSSDSELAPKYTIEQVANIGVYRISEDCRIFGGMFRNGREVGIDIFRREYALSGEKSRGFIGALVKVDKRLKDCFNKEFY